jgi:regulator of cell morphogenesis and NO signaling
MSVAPLAVLEKSTEQLPPEALISHIMWRYHDMHRRELRELLRLSKQAEDQHVIRSVGPERLTPLLHVIAAELERHMVEEEQLLFPLLLSGRALKLDAPINHIRSEHKHHTALLDRLEVLASQWKPFEEKHLVKDLLNALNKFATDLRQHLEIESNVLFPQFTTREVT